MVDFLVLVNQLISKFSTSVESILEEIFPAVASRLIVILSKDAFPSGPGCNTEVWKLKPSTKVFLHALNFSGTNAVRFYNYENDLKIFLLIVIADLDPNHTFLVMCT